MKTLIVLLLSACSMFGAAPTIVTNTIQRQPFTTNLGPTINAKGYAVTNIGNLQSTNLNISGGPGPVLENITLSTGQTASPFVVFDTNSTAPLFQILSNGNVIATGTMTATGQVLTVAGLNGLGSKFTNIFKVALGTNFMDAGAQNPSLVWSGTNSIGTPIFVVAGISNSVWRLQTGSNSTYSATVPLQLDLTSGNLTAPSGTFNLGGSNSLGFTTFTGSVTDILAHLVLGTLLANGITNNGALTNSGDFYNGNNAKISGTITGAVTTVTKLGIATNTPTSQLEVQGVATISGAITNTDAASFGSGTLIVNNSGGATVVGGALNGVSGNFSGTVTAATLRATSGQITGTETNSTMISSNAWIAGSTSNMVSTSSNLIATSLFVSGTETNSTSISSNTWVAGSTSNMVSTSSNLIAQSLFVRGTATNSTLIASNAWIAGSTSNMVSTSSNIFGTSLFVSGTTTSAVVNATSSTITGTLTVNSNIQVQAGQGSSNAWVGGTWYASLAVFTNHSTVGNFTNFASVTMPANQLTNLNDLGRAEWGGFFMPGTNQLQFGFGSQTNLMDTGAQTNGQASAWKAWMELTRSGNTGQHMEGEIWWNQGGGTPFTRTNFNQEVAETNGIANVWKMAGRTLAGRAFGITNNSFRVRYDPAPH